MASCTACNQLPWPPRPASTIDTLAVTTPGHGSARVSTATFLFAYDMRDALRLKHGHPHCGGFATANHDIQGV